MTKIKKSTGLKTREGKSSKQETKGFYLMSEEEKRNYQLQLPKHKCPLCGKTFRGYGNNLKSQVWVENEDIKSIGNTQFEENNMTCFICDFETSHIEKILLRTILQTFGNDFKIVGECDHPYGMIFKTNFPWEKYKSVYYKL